MLRLHMLGITGEVWWLQMLSILPVLLIPVCQGHSRLARENSVGRGRNARRGVRAGQSQKNACTCRRGGARCLRQNIRMHPFAWIGAPRRESQQLLETRDRINRGSGGRARTQSHDVVGLQRRSVKSTSGETSPSSAPLSGLGGQDGGRRRMGDSHRTGSDMVPDT